MTTCAVCGGRRFIKSGRGWQPCDACFIETVSQTYVLPQIRMGEERLPDRWQDSTPLPWLDYVVEGSYDDFRHRVWASLLAYYMGGKRATYDYFEMSRLLDIHFGRDTSQYTSIRQLVELDLLILVGTYAAHNAYGPELFRQVTEGRKMYGRPTWIWQGHRQASLTPSPTTDLSARTGTNRLRDAY